jgi:adenylate cyclase
MNELQKASGKEAQAQAIYDWLLGEARDIEDAELVVSGLGERLNAAGVPVDRLMAGISVLHAQRSGLGRFWQPGQETRTVYFPFGDEARALYERSPFKLAHDTGEWVMLRLDETPDEAFGIVRELKDQGFTHYVCVPVELPGGTQNGLAFATKRPEGFEEDDIALLRALMPALSVLMEIVSLRRIVGEVLKIYVGDEPHRRILEGQIQRGDVLHIQSAILFADMRDFTLLSMGMDAGQLVDLLNGYYDCIVPHIEANGGEVLEYIGDGLLAIFRCEEETGHVACSSAYAAANAALASVRERNAAGPDIAYEAGISLHYGRAAYGNVGSGERLDYTVIGRDVNLASRIAGLCGSLGCSLLLSRTFGEKLGPDELHSIGSHSLRGVAAPQEIFQPAGDACAGECA